MRKLHQALAALSLLLIASTPATAQVGFSRSVAATDTEVYIGEPGNQVASGFVYIYRPEAGGWVEARALTASDAAEGDGFGTAISVHENVLLVSAVTEERGVVYVFHRDAGAWKETGTIAPTESADGERFGSSIARDGEALLVGAPAADEDEGAAYLFRMQDGHWAQVARLIGERPAPEGESEGESGEEPAAEEADEVDPSEDAEAEDAPPYRPERFGAAVAIRGDWAMVGAPESQQSAGAVYVYHRTDDGWEQVSTLGADFSEESDRFGGAITLLEDEVLVGATGVETLGAVRRFTLDDSGEWSRDASLLPYEGSGFGFGSAIAVQGQDVYVGASRADGFQGAIYRYHRNDDGNWTGVTKLGSSGRGRGAGFGASMALSGNTLVAGMPRADFGAGTAIIMTRGYDGWDRTKVLSEVKAMDPITGGGLECTDGKVGRFDCDGVDLLAYLPIPAIGGGRGVWANDIWGWTDPETDRDYAIVGLSNATSFVDVTDPYNPVYVGRIDKTAGSNSSVWRDIKVYADHAFIVSDGAGEHGVQIFDLAQLRDFDGTPLDFSEDAHYDQIYSAHNIVIDEDSAFAFVVGASGGGETCGGGLHMINIEDPKNPVFAGCFSDTRTGRRGTGYSHDAQCVTYHGPDERYDGREICFGSNETALSIADVTDKRNPEAIGMASYPNVAYTHQGWLTEDHAYFYMNDEGDEASGLVEGTRTIIWDVQDLEDPIVVGEYVSSNPAIDHNLFVAGDIMYQSNYDSGLRLFDVSDPENIKPIGYLDTVPFGEDGSGMSGSWSNYPYFGNGVVVVTSMSEGFFVVRRQDTSATDGGDSQ